LGRELLPVGDASEAALSTIAVNNKDDVTTRCSSLFTLWLGRQPNASWKKLIDALKKINLNNLATEIEGKLIPPADSSCSTEDTPEDTMISLPHTSQSNQLRS